MDGTIIRIISNLYTVECLGKIYNCRARGKFYHDGLTPLVGDKVKIDTDNNYILELYERRNSLNRPSVANVDVAIIIQSTKKPDLDLNLLDKLLVLVFHNKITPLICFTKIDLLNSDEKKELKKIIKYYQKLGIITLTNKKPRKILKSIAHKTALLAGQSGAGKSTLLNKLDKNLNLATNPISKALGRGIHTTRHVELFKFKNALIADTPGFSSLDLSNLTDEEIRETYPEFQNICEFKNCSHLNEKNCEVKNLVEKKKIQMSRYKNYVKFIGKKSC